MCVLLCVCVNVCMYTHVCECTCHGMYVEGNFV